MKTAVTIATLIVLLALAVEPSKAASFSCMDDGNLNAAERAVCTNERLGALDERLDSWYRRALVRAGYFDQTDWLRGEQKAWLRTRDECGDSIRCLRRHYRQRIETLKNYVEHV